MSTIPHRPSPTSAHSGAHEAGLPESGVREPAMADGSLVTNDSRVRAVTVHPVTFPRVLRSEWVKFRSLRSSWITLLFAVAALIGLAALLCWAMNRRWDTARPERLAEFEPISQSLSGVSLAQLAIGVLGVLIISGEYGTGMIRASLAAVPRRLPVLAAKTLLYATLTFITTLVAAFLAFFVGQHFLHTHGTTIHATGAARAIIAVAGYLTLVGVLAVALGFILRNTAAGIATLVGLLLILPGIGELLPTDWQGKILPYLPSNAGGSMYAIHRDPTSLSPSGGLLTLAIWCLVALALAAILLRRRDA